MTAKRNETNQALIDAAKVMPGVTIPPASDSMGPSDEVKDAYNAPVTRKRAR